MRVGKGVCTLLKWLIGNKELLEEMGLKVNSPRDAVRPVSEVKEKFVKKGLCDGICSRCPSYFTLKKVKTLRGKDGGWAEIAWQKLRPS